MIQRKQSIWLLIASVFGFLSIKLPFYTGNVTNVTTLQKTYTILNAKEPSLIVFILTLIIAIGSMGVIFLFKNRPKQLIASSVLFVLSSISLILYYFETKKFTDGTYSLTALISAFVPIFLLLAISGIYGDEKLIKNADRLR